MHTADRAGELGVARSVTAFSMLLWLMALSIVVWFAAQDVGLRGQYLLGAAALLGLLLLRVVRTDGLLRVFLILLVAYVSVRYFTWRTLYTLPPVDAPGFVPGLLLYLAEVQGFVIYLLGVFVNIRPVDRRSVPLPDDPEACPTVDVLVPSFNEPLEILRVTLTAARQIDYPADRLQVYLLDDGGTDQKCNDPDPAKAEAARARRAELQALCNELGCRDLSRKRNISAKAGNINAALPHSDGELLLILDADHVPTRDILQRTVGAFVTDPDLFMVQTPHFMATPDPVERNLATFGRMPSEGEMFYGDVQRGLDFWNSSFFCGSAAVMRRRHLESVGGISGSSITEDAETSLELHARGLKSIYLSRPMVAGQAPETFAHFITQRRRWAQGMTQILLLKNPLFKRGLSLAQRLSYLNSCLFWLFPFSRLIFVAAPMFFLFFGLEIFHATLQEFFAFAVLHVFCSLMLANFLFGRERWPFVSDLYEILQSVFLVGSLLRIVVRPRKAQFRVTPKGRTIERDFVSPLGKPFFVIMALMVVGVVLGVYRYYAFPLEREHLTIVMAWHLTNSCLLLGALGVLFERAWSRDYERLYRDKPVNVVTDAAAARGTLVDTTIDGGRIQLSDGALVDDMIADGHGELHFASYDHGEVRSVPLLIEGHQRDSRAGSVDLDVRYVCNDQPTFAGVVDLVYGDSEAWVQFQRSRRRSRRTLLGSLLFIVARGLSRSLGMLGGRRAVVAPSGPREPAATRSRIGHAGGYADASAIAHNG